ncbi:MAG: hypothetical protein QQN41_10545, partial [Nitrosopumilus sp.]
LDVCVLSYFVNNQYVNIASQFILSTKALPKQTRVRRTNLTEKLQLIRTIEEPNCISKYIDSLFDGAFYIDKKQVYLMKGGSMLHHSPTTRSLESDSANRNFCLPYQTSVLEWNGESVRSVIDEFGRLERQLASLDKPIENFYDLIKSHMHYRRDSLHDPGNFIGFVQFLAPVYVSFSGEIRTNKHQLSVGISVENKKKIDISQLSLGIITEEGIRKTIKGSQLKLKTLKGGYLISVDDIGLSRSSTLILKLFGVEVDKVKFSPSTIAYSNFVRDLFGNWKSVLNRVEKNLTNRKYFEKNIATLLSLLGLICNPLSIITGVRDEVVDGIALIPNSDKLIIYECSTESPTVSKMSKFAIRFKKAKEHCSDFDFMGVVFLSINYSDLGDVEKEYAFKSGIKIICKESIDELIDLVRKSYDIRKLIDWLNIEAVKAWPMSALR